MRQIFLAHLVHRLSVMGRGGGRRRSGGSSGGNGEGTWIVAGIFHAHLVPSVMGRGGGGRGGGRRRGGGGGNGDHS